MSIVVNNAGVTSFKGLVIEEADNLNDMFNLNSVAPALLSAQFIKRLKARNNRSAIVNVDSTAGSALIPYQSTYTATKAFLRFFTYGLAA